MDLTEKRRAIGRLVISGKTDWEIAQTLAAADRTGGEQGPALQ